MHPGTKAPIKVYRVTDAAIDRWLARMPTGETVRVEPDAPMPDGARFAWAIYAETRDVRDLVFVEGATPETYNVRTLTLSEAREAMQRVSNVERQCFAFARGLLSVSSWENESGERREWTRPDDRSGKPKPIPESELEDAFDIATMCEIGEVICQLSFHKRQSERSFALPPTSVDALRAISRRRVAPMSGLSSLGASKPVLEATAAVAPTSSRDGAASTGATATGSPSTDSPVQPPLMDGQASDST